MSCLFQKFTYFRDWFLSFFGRYRKVQVLDQENSAQVNSTSKSYPRSELFLVWSNYSKITIFSSFFLQKARFWHNNTRQFFCILNFLFLFFSETPCLEPIVPYIPIATAFWNMKNIFRSFFFFSSVFISWNPAHQKSPVTGTKNHAIFFFLYKKVEWKHQRL